MIISMQKIKDNNCFFLVILLIKETCNLSDATFLWQLPPCRRSKRSINNFPEIMKNTAISLVENILGNNWRTRFFPHMRLLQSHKEHCCYVPLLGLKKRHWIAKAKKTYFRLIVWLFLHNVNYSEKFASFNF